MAVSRQIRIIGVASGLGAQDKACKDGPQAFQGSLVGRELTHHPRVDWVDTLYPPEGGSQSTVQRIAALSRSTADSVEDILRRGAFPLVIGGDHSVAIGTWSGVTRALDAPPGLLWIDAHLDSHTPATSYSGAVHGMPLAVLLGQGDKRLLDIGRRGAQVAAEHTVVFGARSYEPEERVFLERMGVRIYLAEEIGQRGFATCFAEALARVAGAPAGFGVTIDLDAVDPRLAPGVGSPEPDGLLSFDLLDAMRRVAGSPGLMALEIVEYNPDRDQHGATAALLADLVELMLDVPGEGRP